MSQRNALVDAVGLPEAPILRTSARSASGMAFVELDFRRRSAGLTAAVCEDAFLIALQLSACHEYDLFADGRWIERRDFDAGALAIFDLRGNLSADLRDPFHTVDLHMPRTALAVIAEDAGAPPIGELRHSPGAVDPVATRLLLAMRPALAGKPEETPALFVDHVAIALATHIAHAYGGMRVRSVRPGGLAPWQERRAKELLEANLSGGISLAALASACDLSVRHFTRAFRQSTRMAPHEWLLHRRIEKAKGLLARSARALADIAFACGFSDQSHFSRVFARAAGASPGKWRRMREE